MTSATPPPSALLHGTRTLVVGDLELQVAEPSDRKTLEITVERDASVVLKVPMGVTVERAERFVTSKRQWIYRKLADKDAMSGPPIVKEFVSGEGFAYLGRNHRLTLIADDAGTGVRLTGGRFCLPAIHADEGALLMRLWYTEVGGHWLRRRLRPWAARLGAGDVAVDVRDLGYRWGSARPHSATQRINVHWATVQLAPSLVDYVLVHELAHLRETNHTPDFWAIVARLMPAYEHHRASLNRAGKSVWLGATSQRHR